MYPSAPTVLDFYIILASMGATVFLIIVFVFLLYKAVAWVIRTK